MKEKDVEKILQSGKSLSKILGTIFLFVLYAIAGIIGKTVVQKGSLPAPIVISILSVVGVFGYFIFKTFTSSKPQEISEAADLSDAEKKSLVKKQGLTELMVAASEGDRDKLEELLEKGFKVDAKSAIGTTALMYAARGNHAECIECLLAAGADTNIATKGGTTALIFAQRVGNTEAIRLLTRTKS